MDTHDRTLPYTILFEDVENIADAFHQQYRSPQLITDLMLFFLMHMLDFEAHRYQEDEKISIMQALQTALEYRSRFGHWPESTISLEIIAAAYKQPL